MTIARRPSLMEPGEPLLLCRSTVATASRFTAFGNESGLSPDLILMSTLCAMPLPVYTTFGTRKRWAGTRPEFMWHPLMWLPTRVAGRYEVTDPDTGAASLEDDDLWATRVAFELTASGLYNPDDGTWVDILATVGLDVDNEVDLARVSEWLDGEPDELLDSIDLGPYLDIDPTTWAIESAMGMRTVLEESSWALIADDLLGLADDLASPGGGTDRARLLESLRSLAGLAETLLGKVPEPVELAPGEPSNMVFFAAVHDRAAEGPGVVSLADGDSYLSQMRDRLFAIRETYWVSLESLSEGADTEVPASI